MYASIDALKARYYVSNILDASSFVMYVPEFVMWNAP
jgi:hypothetical protein